MELQTLHSVAAETAKLFEEVANLREVARKSEENVDVLRGSREEVLSVVKAVVSSLLVGKKARVVRVFAEREY